MPKLKPTQTGVDRIINHLSHLKARIAGMDEIARLKDSPSWSATKKFLQDRIDIYEKDIVSHAKYGSHLDDHERCKSIDLKRAGQEEDLFFIRLIDNTQEEAEELRAHITEVEEELRAKRAELAEIEGS